MDDRQEGRTREGDTERAHPGLPPLAVVILSVCCLHNPLGQITIPTSPLGSLRCSEAALGPVTGMTVHLVTLPLRGWLVPCKTAPNS